MSYIGQKPAERVLTSADISDAAITADKLASSSVTQPKVNSGVAGTGPAFFATMSTNQTLASGTVTKLQFNTEDFDTNSNYNTSLYRFLPTVAGYYQINLSQEFSVTGNIQGVQIQKNGNRIASGGSPSITGQGTFMSACSTIVYCNGSTDYVEAYGYVNAGAGGTAYNGSSSHFSGAMVRAA